MTRYHEIRDQVELMGSSMRDFAENMGIGVDYAHDIVEGYADITPSIALGLEQVIGKSQAYWLGGEDE